LSEKKCETLNWKELRGHLYPLACTTPSCNSL
jgi:hypothetical protein